MPTVQPSGWPDVVLDLISNVNSQMTVWLEGIVGDALPGWVVGLVFELTLTILFILTVYLISRSREKSFWQRVEEREARLVDVTVSTGDERALRGDATLVHASIVVSQGHYRRLVASFRKLIGGEVKSYRDLHERARREAINRLKENARLLGASHVANLRFTTSSLNPVHGRGALLAVEITAFGTAITG